MGKEFYFKKSRAQGVRKVGQRVASKKLKSGRKVFVLKKR